jgi:hypothetical protein
MKNQSGCVNASASQVGAGIRNASQSGGLVTDPPPLLVSLVIAKDIRSESETAIVIVIVKGTVLESGNETGIGLLDVVVDMAVRVVPAAEADTVEATATGRWPREWDSNVFTHMGPSITLGQTYMNSQPFMDQSQHSVSGTDPLILTKHTIVALADSPFLFDLPIPGYCSLY